MLPTHGGKASALNRGMAVATGEIICFVDVRQTIALNGLKNLVENFADPCVGCVSGELIIRKSKEAPFDGVGFYWRLEKHIRNWEALAGSTVGATGAFYAVRKSLLSPLPEGTILDDVYIPLQVARKGQRVVVDLRAVLWDDFIPGPRQEYRRKVRTLTGNYQLMQLAPWILTPSNPLFLQFICHKLLRLVVPFALVGAMVSAFWVRHGIYGLALVLQVVFYALAVSRIFGSKRNLFSRLANISLAFIVLNIAAAVALFYFVTGRRVVWAR